MKRLSSPSCIRPGSLAREAAARCGSGWETAGRFDVDGDSGEGGRDPRGQPVGVFAEEVGGDFQRLWVAERGDLLAGGRESRPPPRVGTGMSQFLERLGVAQHHGVEPVAAASDQPPACDPAGADAEGCTSQN